jgi:hypothetical protein
VNRKIIYILSAALALISFYAVFSLYRNNTDRLFANLNERLKEEKFEDLYSESSDYVKSSFTKREFVEKMKEAVSKMRRIDGNLNFQRDKGWEQTTPADFPKEQGFKFTVQKITNNDSSAFVIVYWDDKGFFPKFENITISKSDDSNNRWSDEYEFEGI